MEEKLEKILLDLNIGYITVKVAKRKTLRLFDVSERSELSSLIHHCGNELTEKEIFHDHCLKCSEYISED